MTNFKSPKRRLTRQRSGFSVGGKTSGSECKIISSARIEVKQKLFVLRFKREQLNPNLLFLKDLGIVGFGGYIFPKNNLNFKIKIKLKIDDIEESQEKEYTLSASLWNKIGINLDMEINKDSKITDIEGVLEISSNNSHIGELDFFGFNLDIVNYPYFKENYLEKVFNEKLEIYLPEIFYFNFDKPFLVAPDLSLEKFSKGEPIVLKSCNRCSRFLPIDSKKERNTLSFSNHCFKRVPCTHNAFSKYTILDTSEELKKEFKGNIENDKLKMYYGFQLECKSCKKFFVNSPLNPLRNSTQHREDSLRRRAIEILVDTLLNREWIYHKFRLEKRKEFDKHIWEKFGKKCFKCNKKLKNEREMDLDHTMPLASFWPLDETATCLCNRCNSLKSDKFPIEFYSNKELDELTKVTGINIRILKSKKINLEVVEKLIEKIEWFFDDFLNNKDYQKIRNGKRTSDLIYKAIMKQLRTFYKNDIDLVEIYKKKLGRNPYTRVRKVFC